MKTKETDNQSDMKSGVATSIAIVLFVVLTWRYLPEAIENMLTTLSQAILEIYLGIRFMKSALKIIVNVPCQDDAEENITPQSINAEGYMRLLVLISIGMLDAINILKYSHGVEDMVSAAITGGTYPMNPFADLYYRMFFIHMLVYSIDALPDIVEMITSRKKKSI